jgi:hypothetical protein
MVSSTNHIFRRRPSTQRLSTYGCYGNRRNIDGWAVSKILVDGGSSADIILGRAEHPLFGFDGKKIHSIGRIILLVSFETVSNARTKQITFDVVDMYYPYSALFGRETLNAFEAVISYSYLRMKMQTINGVITIHEDQTEARNIEKKYTLGQKNVHAIVEEEKEKAKPQTKAQACEETKRVPLHPLVPDKQSSLALDSIKKKRTNLWNFFEAIKIYSLGYPMI